MPCFVKGCVVVAAIMAAIVLLLWGAGLYFRSVFGPFVSEQEVALRANDTTNEQYTAAMRKLQPLLVMDASAQPVAATPIALTADDLNALVAHDPRLADARNKCYFAIVGDQLAVDVSTMIPQKNSAARGTYYVNARLSGDVNIADGEVQLTPRKIESLDGKQFPAWAMNNRLFQSMVDGLNDGINRSIHDNTDLSGLVAKIASAKLENGQLVITPVKPGGPAR